jgi:hypothetical protein
VKAALAAIAFFQKVNLFRPRADAMPCGMPCAECGDEEIRAQPEESEGSL